MNTITTTTTGTRYPELFASLAAPFEGGEVKALSKGKGGRTIHYVTARTVQNRLDQVLGPENWWPAFQPAGESSVLCLLTIRLPDGQVVTKCDAGGAADMSDEGDADKSAHSDALKRAAAMFGVARYLYKDGVPQFVRDYVHGKIEVADTGKPKKLEAHPPQSKPRALPSPSPSPSPVQEPAPVPLPLPPGCPADGKALYKWLKDRELACRFELSKYLGQWGRLQGLPVKMLGWDADQVALGYLEAVRKIESLAPATNGVHVNGNGNGNGNGKH